MFDNLQVKDNIIDKQPVYIEEPKKTPGEHSSPGVLG